MKKQDFAFILALTGIFLPFIIFQQAYDFMYHKETGFNTNYPIIASFIKFAILATMGEFLGLRIQTGKYLKKGFGIIPRAIVWGFLGIFIKIAFVIFDGGTLVFVEKIIGIQNPEQIMQGKLSFEKVFIAFLIGTFLNIMFAPVFMTIHKITDTHILMNEGKLKSLIVPIKIEKIITSLNWKVQWNFIFKKTIPLFWIPAQTVNFCFPDQFRILNAAILGIVLGVILSFANLKK